MTKPDLRLIVEFGAGAEKVFGNIKKHELLLDGTRPWTVRQLLTYLVDNIMTGPLEMFMMNNTVRPGILVLINDTDWELLGEHDYNLETNDHVLFISSLHGG